MTLRLVVFEVQIKEKRCALTDAPGNVRRAHVGVSGHGVVEVRPGKYRAVETAPGKGAAIEVGLDKFGMVELGVGEDGI